MDFEVSAPIDASEALDYFNGFHDGFIQELRVRSNDHFLERGVHETAGPVDVEIVFAHYNYERDTRPVGQQIRATFEGVTELQVEITGLPTESAIRGVTIGPTDGDQPLRVEIRTSRLTQARKWIDHEAVSFDCERARFEEL